MSKINGLHSNLKGLVIEGKSRPVRFLFKANLDEVVRATASGVQPEDQTESAPTSSAGLLSQKY